MTRTYLIALLLLPAFLFCQKASQPAKADPASYTSEKAYLHFDKPYYVLGDTIYFKGYITISGEHKLSALSGVLYVELIGPEGKLTRSENLQITAGTASGDFVLNDTLKSGTYHVRAYTNWMRNEGEDSFFEKEIPVGSVATVSLPESGNPKSRKATQAKEIQKSDIQFMPEGGSLVAGNYSKIGFKAIGTDGYSRNIKGSITDETGSEVTTFASNHAGMGSFALVPQVGKTYKANITFDDGSHTTVDLPKPTETGYTISVNNANIDTLRIRITAGPNGTTDKLSLVAKAGNTIYYAAENQQTGARFFSAVIPKSKFPTGIVQLTLYSANQEPLNERLVFINNNQLELKIKADKQTYQTRDKVKLELTTGDKTNKINPGSFSVSITDESKVPADTSNENNILSYLLLTSDLRGYIEDPAYYFRNNNEQTQTDLDNLLLTQGYRHFEWKQDPQYLPEKAFTISGKVIKWSKPVEGAKVKLFTTKGGLFMLDTLTNKEGRFAFKDLIFTDSTKFVVQSKVAKGQDAVTLELDTLPASKTKFEVPGISIKEHGEEGKVDLTKYIANQKQFYEEQLKYGINKHAVMLSEVKVEEKKETSIPHSDNLNGAGHADEIVTVKQLKDKPCVRIIDCLFGMMVDVSFGRDGTAVNKRYGGKMGIMINGDFVEPSDFADLSPDNIEGIEVLLGAHYGAIYGPRAANGLIIVTLKRASKTNNYYRYAPGVVTYMPKGFYKAREFYAPQYDNPKTNQKIPDLRSTIYWNPNVITDKDGKASFSYFNADGKGTYRVVLEGIDADGNIGRTVYRYNVE